MDIIIIYSPINLAVNKLGLCLFIIIYIPHIPIKTNKKANQTPTKNAANPFITSATIPNGQQPTIHIKSKRILEH